MLHTVFLLDARFQLVAVDCLASSLLKVMALEHLSYWSVVNMADILKEDSGSVQILAHRW